MNDRITILIFKYLIQFQYGKYTAGQKSSFTFKKLTLYLMKYTIAIGYGKKDEDCPLLNELIVVGLDLESGSSSSSRYPLISSSKKQT